MRGDLPVELMVFASNNKTSTTAVTIPSNLTASRTWIYNDHILVLCHVRLEAMYLLWKKNILWKQSMYLVGCKHSLETSSEIEVHCTQPVNNLLCLLSLDLALSSNASPGTNSISCTSDLPPSSSITFTAEICGSAFFSSSICEYCACDLPVWTIDQ